MPTPTVIHTDAVIIGAGGGGMCLLHAMHRQGYLHGRTLHVVEPQNKQGNDRTWCFWAKPDSQIAKDLESVISYRWECARTPKGEEALAPYRYYHIRSSDFYAFVKEELSGYGNIHWVQERVERVDIQERQGLVDTEDHRLIAPKVFDSRIPPAKQESLKGPDTLWQSFLGYRVRLERPIPEPAAMELMRFDIDQSEATQFLYVLPFGQNEALIELTRFSPDDLGESRGSKQLDGWIRRHFGEYSIMETERGRIPMSLALNPQQRLLPKNSVHIPIGTAAGAVKATTGYAFKRMFHHGYDLGEAWAKQEPSATAYHPKRWSFYDALLLRILKNRPSRGKPVFEALLQHTPITKVFRFLDEKSGLADEAKMFGKLPILTFAKALFGHLRSQIKFEASALILLLLSVLAVVGYQFWPEATSDISPWLLLLGMLFPGIPHGAVDHYVSGHGRLSAGGLVKFVGGYVSIMLLVLGLWLLLPSLGLLSFLLYSGWHFGETDMKGWGVRASWPTWMYGSGLLAFLLGSHGSELVYYWNAFSLPELAAIWPQITDWIWAGGLLALLASLVYIPIQKIGGWLSVVAILLIGAKLPLLLAFGLYFIGNHSVKGWMDLKSGLRESASSLLAKAAPFSVMAYLLFIVLWIASQQLDWSFQEVMPSLFVFIAAVSAPHIWYMHGFYTRKEG